MGRSSGGGGRSGGGAVGSVRGVVGDDDGAPLYGSVTTRFGVARRGDYIEAGTRGIGGTMDYAERNYLMPDGSRQTMVIYRDERGRISSVLARRISAVVRS